MAILTGGKILEELAAGRLVIRPLNPDQVGPNSVDLTLSERLLVYCPVLRSDPSRPWERQVEALDMRCDNPTREVVIPSGGMMLYPGEIYLGSTVEWTEIPYHAPRLDGRSSVGRLGMKIHVTAGLGDIGFRGHWTLEIEVTKPLIVYPGVRICQLVLETTEGVVTPYNGRYQDQAGAVGSRFHEGNQEQRVRTRYVGPLPGEVSLSDQPVSPPQRVYPANWVYRNHTIRSAE